jgi:EpsI family protein
MNKRYLILVGVLFVATILTYFLSRNVPAQQQSTYAKELPVLVNDWYGEDIKVDERTLEILETDDVIIRVYRKKQSIPVELCIVYASNNRKVAHPPEICYKGGGWSLEEKKHVVFPIKSNKYPEVRANKLIIEKGDKTQLVLYWYKCNKDFTSNYYRQQINIVMNEIRSGKSTSGLIRFSTLIVNNDEDGAMMRIQNFISDMLPLLIKYLP